METIEKTAPGKREARKQERRQAILDIAAQTFLEQGYAAASMSAIAAEIGGSKATLWSYFPSKEELFSAVVQTRIANYRDQLAVLLDPAQDIRTSLSNFCRRFILTVTSPDAFALHRLVSAECGRFPELGAIFYRHGPQQTRALLAAFLERHMDEGHISRVDPALASRALLSLCTGGAQQDMLWGRPKVDAATLQAEADFAVDMFLRAFGESASR